MAQAIRSTRVLTPEGLRPATLIIEGERIAAVLGWSDAPSLAGLCDYGDHVLLPGLVDSHVHINEPGRADWEGFWTASRAAASGGVTTLVDMPLNCIPETIDVIALKAKREVACNSAWVDWAAWGGLVRDNLSSLDALAAAGIPGFKCFLIHSGIDGFPSVNESELRRALEKLRGTGLPLLAHAEIAGPIEEATARLNDSGLDWRKYSTYLASRPGSSEHEAIALLIRLADEFQAHVHIVHLSSADALPLICKARENGVHLTVETCVQYLWFASEEIPDGATEFKCAPPIRSAANRDALWSGLEHGLLDLVATDHSPCPPDMKCRNEGRFDRAWGGIAGLGLALQVMNTAMQRRGVPLPVAMARVARWMSAAPAELAGLAPRKGSLAVGADADLAIFDPQARWTVTENGLQFRHKISPYIGAELRGRVLETWLRGERVFSASGFADQPRGKEQVRS